MQREDGARRPPWPELLAGLLLVLSPLLAASRAQAEVGFREPSYIVVNARSGQVITAVAPEATRYPASLTKLMTLYLTFEGLRDRRISLETRIPVSEHAASVEPVKLGLPPGSSLTIQQAILSMVTLSANDAATALGEYLGGGSEPRFAQMMTLRARAIGMAHTTFRNASGLPDPDQVTTARDMAILARRLIIDFPEQYHWFSTRRFLFGHRWIVSHDYLLKAYPGADGLKTGYTHAAGHNLVSSAERGYVRLIGVVLGAQTIPEVDGEMMALLNQGFAEENAPELAANTVAAAESPLSGLLPAAHAATPPKLPTPAAAPTAAPADAPPEWGVQVAAYTSEHMAQYVAGLAGRIVPEARPAVDATTQHGRQLWRVRLLDLSATGAKSACASLAQHKLPCWLLPPHPGGELASR